MRNHYHLAVETPQANLVDGMHWLQTTVSTRFNRYRNERGRLFQGRYQAVLLEEVSTLARVVNYLHLNPVRANLVAAEQAANFRWSSLSRFVRGNRFPSLVAKNWLDALGLIDTQGGWAGYAEQLVELSHDPKEQKKQGFDQLSQGWAFGTPGWKKALAQDHAHRALFPGIEKKQLRALKEARWSRRLEELMRAAKRTVQDARSSPKNAPWKISIARALRQSQGASVVWLAQALLMGKPSTTRNYLYDAPNHP